MQFNQCWNLMLQDCSCSDYICCSPAATPLTCIGSLLFGYTEIFSCFPAICCRVASVPNCCDRRFNKDTRNLNFFSVTIVTGGNRGLGFYTAKHFANRGRHVIILSRTASGDVFISLFIKFCIQSTPIQYIDRSLYSDVSTSIFRWWFCCQNSSLSDRKPFCRKFTMRFRWCGRTFSYLKPSFDFWNKFCSNA